MTIRGRVQDLRLFKSFRPNWHKFSCQATTPKYVCFMSKKKLIMSSKTKSLHKKSPCSQNLDDTWQSYHHCLALQILEMDHLKKSEIISNWAFKRLISQEWKPISLIHKNNLKAYLILFSVMILLFAKRLWNFNNFHKSSPFHRICLHIFQNWQPHTISKHGRLYLIVYIQTTFISLLGLRSRSNGQLLNLNLNISKYERKSCGNFSTIKLV